MNFRNFWISISFASLIANVAICKESPNYSYVQSMDSGIFYARSIPAAETGTLGATEIYLVGKDHDELVDKYDWYCKNGVSLGWSPIAGKVAVLAIQMGSKNTVDNQAELSFYMGGKFLKTWTANQLIALGAEEAVEMPGGRHAVYRVLGCKQAKGNMFVFAIRIAGGKKLFFDIMTGDLYRGEVLQDRLD